MAQQWTVKESVSVNFTQEEEVIRDGQIVSRTTEQSNFTGT